MTDPRSPFAWRRNTEPTIFARDPAFTPRDKAGRTMSQINSAAVDRITAKTGRNPGTLEGLSKKAAERQPAHYRRGRT